MLLGPNGDAVSNHTEHGVLPAMLRWGQRSALVAQTPVRSSTGHDGVAMPLDALTKPQSRRGQQAAAAICMKSGGPQHDLQVALPPSQHLHEID